MYNTAASWWITNTKRLLGGLTIREYRNKLPKQEQNLRHAYGARAT